MRWVFHFFEFCIPYPILRIPLRVLLPFFLLLPLLPLLPGNSKWPRTFIYVSVPWPSNRVWSNSLTLRTDKHDFSIPNCTYTSERWCSDSKPGSQKKNAQQYLSPSGWCHCRTITTFLTSRTHTTHQSNLGQLTTPICCWYKYWSHAETVVSCTPGPVSSSMVKIGLLRLVTIESPTLGMSRPNSSWLWCIDMTSFVTSGNPNPKKSTTWRPKFVERLASRFDNRMHYIV